MAQNDLERHGITRKPPFLFLRIATCESDDIHEPRRSHHGTVRATCEKWSLGRGSSQHSKRRFPCRSKSFCAICLNLGELNSAKEGQMCRAVELVLNPSHASKPKYIRLKMTVPSGWRRDRKIEEFSFRRFLDKIISSLTKPEVLSRKYKSISFHLEIRHKVGSAAKLEQELSMGIPSLLCSLEKLTEKVTFSISLKMEKCPHFQIRGDIAEKLNPLVEESTYSILKRGKGEDALSLVISSKNWDYCLSGDKWEVDCKECELDLYGWEIIRRRAGKGGFGGTGYN